MSLAQGQDPNELMKLAIGPACHELRGPLAVVYGFARMLETDESLNETGQKYIGQITRAAESLNNLLDDLANLGRTAAGRVTPRVEVSSLKELIDELANRFEGTNRLRYDTGQDVSIKVDAQWFVDALAAVIDALCFEESVDVHLTWRIDPHEVQVQLVPNSTFPMIDVEPEKSALSLSLARMRVIVMGGTFHGQGDRVVISLPRS